MNKGQVFILDKWEQEIVELAAHQRHNNKVKTGWDGHGTVNKNSSLELEFGLVGVYILEFNLYPDFKIHNTSKKLGSDYYDAFIWNKTDVKTNRTR